jgi:hypothetical protein
VDYEGDPHLREEHNLGGPITVLGGYLQLYRDGDVELEAILAPMTRATLDLTAELLELGRAAIAARAPK